MDNIIASFAVALGFDVDKSSQQRATKSMADYEKAIKDAEARVAKARADGAKAAIQIGALKELAQAREALEAAKAAAKIADAEREKATAAERSSKRIADAERERAKAHGEATAFAIAKFALLIAAMQKAASAASGALSGTVADFNRLYYVSGRTGSSVASLKALGYAFEQTGSSAHDAISAVESFTQAMRSNPGAKQFVDNLGVDKNLGGVERLISAVDKLNERHAPYIAQQYATGILGLSVEQYNQFTLQGREMKRLLDQRREFAKSIGLDEQQGADASKRFSQALGEISMMAETTFQRVLIDVLPRLTGWIDKARTWLREHQADIGKWVDWAEEKIRAFATAIEGYFKNGVGNGFEDLFGEDLGKKFDRFNERLAKLAESLKTIAGFVRTLAPYVRELFTREAIPGLGNAATGTLNGLGGAGTAGDAPADTRRWYEKVLPKALGGKDAPGTGDSGGDGIRARSRRGIGRLARSGNVQAIVGELRQAGYGDNAIAAVVGSMETESSFNPRAHNDQSGGHTGLWQWDRSRWPRVKNWIQSQGGDPYDAGWQTKAWIAEHNAKPGDPMYDHPRTARGGAILRANPTIDEAIHGVRESERFGPGEEGGRARHAREWLPHVSSVGATPPTAAPAPVVPPAATMRGLPAGMSPGGFDPNRIDPRDLMKPAPAGASPVTNNASNSSRAVTQNITNNVKVDGSSAPREHGRVIQSSLNAVHGLALANAQSAVA